MARHAPGVSGVAEADELPTRAPASVGEIFRVFNRLALQGFGGVLPIAHRELVERERWLSEVQFAELLTVCQVLPGPNIVNLGLILGDRHFGGRGAAAACFGLMTVPMAIVLALTIGYQQFAGQAAVAGALRGMGAVAAGLIFATAVKLARTLKSNPVGWPLGLLLGALTFALVGLLRWPMVWVLMGLGPTAMALAWWSIRRHESGA
jgi:chromate transporter